MAADPTPTEVGTIFARLRMKADEFYADIQRVKEATREVGRESPSIRVTANTGEALAALAEVQAAADAAGRDSGSVTPGAVAPSAPSSGGNGGSGGTARITTAEAATRRLTAAQDALAAASARAEAARKRLTIADTSALAAMEAADAAAMRTRRNDEEIAAAQNRATAADARADIALVALQEAERKVEVAKRKVAEASLAEAAAQEVANTANETANKGDSGGGRVQQWQLIAGLIAGLIPLVAPLGGYLVGVAGGFTMMGAAGVAAILGIKKEMEDGSALGQQYSAGLSLLGDGLDRIEHTGATSVLHGFQGAVAAVQSAMPFLNAETATFGGLLGNTVALSVQALVSLLRGLNPLLVGGAVAVQGFARGLVDLGNSKGLAQFADYGVRMLPTVGAFLQHILSTVGNLVAATAPLGQVMMVALNGVLSVVDVISSLGPVFPVVVAGALSLWGAFALYGKVGPLLNTAAGGVLKLLGFLGLETGVTVANTGAKEANAAATAAMAGAEDVAAGSSVALGAALDFAAGPIGWVVGGIAALVAVLGTVAAVSSDAAAATTDYTAAVQQDNGVIGENTRQTAANALVKSGATDAAKKLGIASKTLTDAATGNAGAQAKVNDAQKKAYAQMSAGTAKTHEQYMAQLDAARAADKLKQSTEAQGASVKTAIKAYNDMQKAVGGTTISTAAQYREQEKLAGVYGMSLPTYVAAQAANKKVADQAAAAAAQMLLEGDYAGLLKVKLDELNGKALTAAEAQGAWASALDAAKSGINGTSKSLDGNTRAGAENQAQLAQMIGVGETALEQYANTAKNQDAVIARHKQMKQALIDEMVKNGEDRATVTKLVNEWFKLPKKVTTKAVTDVVEAQNRLRALQQKLDGLHGKRVTVTVAAQLDMTNSQIKIASMAADGVDYFGNPTGRKDGGSIPKVRHAADGATVRGNGGSLMDQAGLWALANGEEIISNRNGQADRNRPLLKAINAGAVFAPAGSVAAPAAQKAAPQRVVHVGGVHLHSPVAQDPVQAAEDASQLIAAYAAFPG